jgi:hypothetical protein
MGLLFSSSFLFSIAVIILLIGGIFAYVSYRMAEQDSKLNSMISLINIIASELRNMRGGVSSDEEKYDKDLITVSDNGEEEFRYALEDDVEDDDVEDDDVEEEDDVEEDNDSEEENDVVEDNIDIDNELENECSYEMENIDDCEYEKVFEEDKSEYKTIHIDLPEEKSEYKTIHIDLHEDDVKNTEPQEFEEDVKNVDVELPEELNLSKTNHNDETNEDVNYSTNETKYKKMSLNKLREIVVNKGLTTDASKLKKYDLLKLLGEE